VKNQYVGDVNDFYKYALLRALADAHATRVVVCWMLTAPDGRRDGSRLMYLERPQAFASLDPPLFEALGQLVAEGRRSVADVRAASVLPSAVFVEEVLGESASQRSAYFDDLWRGLEDGDLVFFDPDNGLAIQSMPKGRRGSSKYLYWDELRRTLNGSRSVCVYQHFPRVERERFVRQLLARMSGLAPQHRLFALHTSFVAYLVAADVHDADRLQSAAESVAERSAGRLRFLQPETLDP
jgi:hypothetical protein